MRQRTDASSLLAFHHRPDWLRVSFRLQRMRRGRPMTRAPLQHAYPQLMPPEHEPSAPLDDYREVWIGEMRLVRNPRRTRQLRRRGVPLMDTGERTQRKSHIVFAWFVEGL
jgi:hypothetical protein